VSIAYFPISRLSLTWGAIGCLRLEELSERELVESLNTSYRKYVNDLFQASTEKGVVKLRPPRVRESFMSFMTSFKLSLQSGVQRIAFRLTRRRCEPPELVRSPWRLIKLNEGEVRFSCPPPRTLVGNNCKSPNPLSESLICEGREGKVAVKDYYRLTTVKWIPATLASNIFGVKYRLGAKSRLAAEVKYFPLLRRVVRTPKVLKVCVDYGQAFMVREYAEGEPLVNLRDPSAWEEVGRILARLHREGISLGDPNPGNFVAGEDMWIVDAEQAREITDVTGKLEAWDILVFLVYSLFLGVPKELLRNSLEGYAGLNRETWQRVKRRALSAQVWASLGLVAPDLYTAQRLIRDV